MEKSIIPGLAQNVAILLAFSMIYDYSWVPKEKTKKNADKVLAGFIIGSIGIILMLSPWRQVPGIVFDTRSILLALTGLFFGFIPTLVAVAMTSLFRVITGGPGLWMGLAVIFSAASSGLLWRKYRPGWNGKNYILELTALGFTVHLVMLACTVFLPGEVAGRTIQNIYIPILTIYPIGTVLLGILMVRQLTNRKNRDAALKLLESERRFVDLLTNFNYFSIILDKDGNINFCNSKVLDVSGYTIEELSGKNVFEYLIPERSVSSMKDVFSYILTGKTGFYKYESEFKKGDGSVIFVEWNVTVLRDRNKIITSIAAIGDDITDRKNADEELIRAKSRAEESDRLKSIFLSNMSHEIRTPMNAIMGFSSLLGNSEISEKEKSQFIGIIQDSGDRLLSIINDIIDISKLEAKQLSISLSEFNLYEIFTTSEELFGKSEILRSKEGIKLILNVQEEYKSLKIESDKNRFQQILDNLISNAIKYTQSGFIETGFRIIDKSGQSMVEVYIKDTGIGIPENMNGIIFERFRQVDENTYHEGAGLGLSITKGLIDLMGGEIWFTSELNKGTTFYFTIPLKVTEIRPQEGVYLSNDSPDLQGKTIIIAEDDYNSFYYLKILLRDLNATILHADTGSVLMRLVRHKTPDLILLDINMPVMSGLECLEEFKLSGIRTKIIAQTAYAMETEKERYLKAGCDGYISKPLNKSDLYREINKVLS